MDEDRSLDMLLDMVERNFNFFEIFDLARPWSRSRSKVKVKVKFEAPLNKLSYELNTKGL